MLLIEIGGQLLSIFSFLKDTGFSIIQANNTVHFLSIARFLCIFKCFLKYIDPMDADQMHCLLQIRMSVPFTSDIGNLVII